MLFSPVCFRREGWYRAGVLVYASVQFSAPGVFSEVEVEDMKSREESYRIGTDGRFESQAPGKPMRQRVELAAAVLASAREGFGAQELHLELFDGDRNWEVKAELVPEEELIDIWTATREGEW